MKSLVFGILVFYTFVYTTYSFKCYECGTGQFNDGDYTVEQCEKDQKEVECPAANYTCFTQHGFFTGGQERVVKGCTLKAFYEEVMKKHCEEEPLKKAQNITECTASCCVSNGDKPCNTWAESSGDENGGFTVSINMFMIMLAVLCSLKLF